MQSQSASTIATLIHHPSDTLITRASQRDDGRSREDPEEVNKLYDLAKTVLSTEKYMRSAGGIKSRPSSGKISTLSQTSNTRKHDLHIVAHKIH